MITVSIFNRKGHIKEKKGNSEEHSLPKYKAMGKQSQKRNHKRTQEPLPALWREHASALSGTQTAFYSWSTVPVTGLLDALHTTVREETKNRSEN